MTRGGRRRTRTEPQRRCVVSGQSGPCAGLVRFVVGPDGAVVPAVADRLPGRRIWVRARHALVAKAVSRGHFARASRRAGVAGKGAAGRSTPAAGLGGHLARNGGRCLCLGMRAGRVNIPDVCRVGYGLGRRGGVRPAR